MCGKKKGKQEIHKMCRLPPRLLYNRSRTEQEGIFYPCWSLICAAKTEIRDNQGLIKPELLQTRLLQNVSLSRALGGCTYPQKACHLV